MDVLVPILIPIMVVALIASPVTYSRALRRARADTDRVRRRGAGEGPYRTSAASETTEHEEQPDRSGEALLGGFLAVQFLVPAFVASLLMLPTDAATCFAPCALAAFAMWSWGPLVLARAKDAAAAGRIAAGMSLMVGTALLVPPAVHALVAETEFTHSIEHSCSFCPLSWMVIVYAVCTIAQSVLMLGVAREHANIREKDSND